MTSVLLSVLSFIASIVCLIIGFAGEDEMLIIGFILLGSSVLCYLLYGFGEMIKQLKEINRKMK